MGGYGSGPGKSLAIFEEGLKLDLRRLRRQGIFTPNGNYIRTTLGWANSHCREEVASAAISFCTGQSGGWFQLSYNATTNDGTVHSVRESITLVRFPQPFGGYRWYFICPTTGTRCQCLYKPCGYPYFRSQRVFKGRVLYHSQKKDWRSRVFGKSRRIARRVLSAGQREWQKQFEEFDFPPKPPRMRWQTYDRLYAKWECCEEVSDKLIAGYVARLGRP